MENLDYFIGVDISKNSLDICVLYDEKHTEFFKIQNTYETIKSFFLVFDISKIVVCFESTSNYGVLLSKFLTDYKIIYSEINSFKASLFLRHLSHIKTDLQDSFGLAFYCKKFANFIIHSKFNSKFKLIRSYNSTRSLIVKMETQIKNFEKSQEFINDENLKNIIISLKNNLKNLSEKLLNLSYEILKIEIPQTDEILKNNKGFGKILALNLFPVLFYNKNKNAKQIISYLGLSPIVYQSGISVKKNPHINKIGNPYIRKILFFSALSCIKHNEIFKSRYERMLLNNKPKKVAIVAVCCAIIRYLKSYYFKD